MIDEEQADSESGREKAGAKFVEFLENCLDESWSPTRCPEGCSVEPDGVCPHGYQSIALEYALV